MEVPSAGIVNRYIATQGPLPHTAGDFWYMVWEQCATTIVMLTTTVENGRIKCHQYWPEKGDQLEFGQLQITNLDQRANRYCHYRELSVRNKMVSAQFMDQSLSGCRRWRSDVSRRCSTRPGPTTACPRTRGTSWTSWPRCARRASARWSRWWCTARR